MNDDFYCSQVLNNLMQVEKLIETEKVLAFYHTAPTWETHIVIIPKEHITSLSEVNDTVIIQEIFDVMLQIVKDKGLTESNYKVIVNGGSYQSSQHLHFHLVSGKPLDSDNSAQQGELKV